MRLIDADALRVNVDAAYDSYEYECRTDFYKVMDDAPTIDAIPVEWLEKRRENLLFAAMTLSTVYGDNSIELCHAVNIVLDMWQKEQEAR